MPGKGGSMEGLGNQGGGPRREASLSQSGNAAKGGANTAGTINSGGSGSGGDMNAVQEKRPNASKPDGGLGN